MGNQTGRPSSATAREICAAYQSGENGFDIAFRLGLSYYHVKKCLVRGGVQIRSRSDTNTLRRPFVDPTELRRILDEAKMLHHETAEHFGVSVSTLTRVMRSLGYKSVKGKGSSGQKNYFWRGGRCLDSDGYVLVKMPEHPHANNNGYVREHRLVMEKKLGRHLLPHEVVHHRDENKQNNAPRNLRVYRSNAEHLRDELTGRTPNYTPDGLRRMRENAQRVNRRRWSASRKRSKSDAGGSR
jgi:hypothetical protein